MILHIRSRLLCALLFFFKGGNIKKISAQSLDIIKDKQPFLLNGFVSTNQVYVILSADSSIKTCSSYYTRCLKFIQRVNTSLTFIYKYDQESFIHSFNKIGMYPTFKWIKGYIGYVTMSLIPYTFSGHLFHGGGIEIDPPGLFYGRSS